MLVVAVPKRRARAHTCSKPCHLTHSLFLQDDQDQMETTVPSQNDNNNSNNAGQAEEETKLCGACGEDLPRLSFAKKQWLCRRERRCKDCIAAGKEIDRSIVPGAAAQAAAAANPNNNQKKKKGQKPMPVRAGRHEGLHKPIDRDAEYTAAVAGAFCSWCGKAEETEALMQCQACRNIEYCSRECQKAAWPEHQQDCKQLKRDRKNSKKERKRRGQEGALFFTEASGVGSFAYNYSPEGGLYFVSTKGELRGDEQPGTFFASPAAEQNLKRKLGNGITMLQQKMDEDCFSKRGTFERTEFFSDVKELDPTMQFLLACGTLNDISSAKKIFPLVLHLLSISGRKPDGSIPDITDITVRGYGLNALEWAARRGNFEIAEWLATDPRTKVMATRADSAPVAWACYTNKVELAKMLIQNGGANSHATTDVVFGKKPPTHLAAGNGSFLAVKFLVEECGHDIFERDTRGMNIRTCLRRNNPNWRDQAGCVAVDDYAKSRGVREYA